MKKISITLVLSLAIIAFVFNACQDKFSEEDALEAQQTIDLSVYVFDGYNKDGVKGASVSLIKDGDEKTEKTNELGVATFDEVKIGSNMPVKIKKEGYTSVRKMINISGIDYRQGSYTVDVPVLSLDSNTATIKGELDIQTNLTNDSVEAPPEGTQVKAYVDLSNIGSGNLEEIELIAETDQAGKFEFTVPSNSKEGVDVDFTYSTLTLNQTIAKNRDKGQPMFPETEPSIAEISTVFNPSGSAVNIPNDVPSVYAIAPEPTNDGERAVIDKYDVDVQDDTISYVAISQVGTGYNADDTVNIEINSLFDGQGAEVEGITNGNGDLYKADVISGGSGYPEFNFANRVGSSQAPSFNFSISNLKSGEIRAIKGDYGTGTYREQEIK